MNKIEGILMISGPNAYVFNRAKGCSQAKMLDTYHALIARDSCQVFLLSSDEEVLVLVDGVPERSLFNRATVMKIAGVTRYDVVDGSRWMA